MLLANLDDINVFLPNDKIESLDADEDPYSLDAERIIKAKLSGTFSPVVLAAWTTPATTPDVIRSIAGRFIAALYYRKTFSAEETEVPEYAQTLYNEAMDMVVEIVDGDMLLIGVDDIEIPSTTGGNLSSDDFTPNDSTTAKAMFTVSQKW